MNSRRRPSIILVITDDQGAGDMGCQGNPILKTPAMDRLCHEGLRLTNFHVGPTCAPTRAGILTGRYHNCTGVWHTLMGRSLLRRDEITLADVLAGQGYVTGLFGKWHLGDNFPFRPEDNGYQEAIYHRGGGVGHIADYWENDYFDDTYFHRGKPVPFEGYCTDVWFRLARDFISRHREKPFFCHLATNAPHHPYRVPAGYAAPYRGKVPDDRADFYGMIANIDNNLAQLRCHLESEGLTEDTIFIFLGDNGTSAGATADPETQFITEGFNAGYRGIKGSEYEGGHRVPLLLYWPNGGWTGGRDISQLTANIDMMPTLLSACQVPPPTGNPMHGRDLTPLLDNPLVPWPARTIVTDSQRVDHPVKWKQSAVMTEQWRLINGVELYDILADPGQRNDIADQHPDICRELRSAYEDWWKLVSERFDEYIPIVIGAREEPEACLTCHDWHGDFPAWNQFLIRRGTLGRGFWAIDVERDGTYQFELRRWPREEDRAFGEGIPGELGWYSGGTALPITSASISWGNEYTQRAEMAVAPGDKAAVFSIPLVAGSLRIRAEFNGPDGFGMGSYYIYVKRLESETSEP